MTVLCQWPLDPRLQPTVQYVNYVLLCYIYEKNISILVIEQNSNQSLFLNENKSKNNPKLIKVFSKKIAWLYF